MTDRDSEIDFENLDINQTLLADTVPKKKPKAKAKKKAASESKTTTSTFTVPLSMQELSEGDKLQYTSLSGSVKKGTPKDYSPTQSYKTGDVIQHKTFGLGFVTAVTGKKMEVLFPETKKLLVMG
jgi:hypothetical protein